MPTPFHSRALLTWALAAAVTLAGCASTREPDESLAGATPSNVAQGVLPALGELPVLMLPVQRAAVEPGLPWTLPGGAAGATRMADSVLNDVLVLRGAGSKWQFAEQARRTARRNPTYVADPDALAVNSLARLRPGDALLEPLASELRGLVALGDARHVLLPVELRAQPAEGDPPGTARMVLLLAAVDARLSQLLWMGPIAGDPATAFNAAAVESVAAKLADLVVAR